MSFRSPTSYLTVAVWIGVLYVVSVAFADEAVSVHWIEEPRGEMVQDVHAFAGQEYHCKWIVTPANDMPVKVLLDVFQVLSATVVPLSKDLVVGDIRRPHGGEVVEVSHSFPVPDSDLELKYLLVLSIETSGTRSALSKLVVHAVPGNTLQSMDGLTIAHQGFTKDEIRWLAPLAEHGANLVESTAEAGTIQLIRIPDGSVHPSGGIPLEENQRILYFEDRPRSLDYTLVRKSGAGWIVATNLDLLRDLGTSPGAQIFFVNLLTTTPN